MAASSSPEAGDGQVRGGSDRHICMFSLFNFSSIFPGGQLTQWRHQDFVTEGKVRYWSIWGLE